MRFSCTQENLLRGVNLTARVASRAGNLPILSNIHLKASPAGVEMKATNLEIGVTAAVRGKVEEPGEFTVPAKLFSDYIAFLPKDKVDIALAGGELTISCGKHTTKIKGMPASEFPLIPAVEEEEAVGVELETLLEGLEQVLFSISPGETRPEISGALLATGERTLTLAGTDSYRLAEKMIAADGGGKRTERYIVPLRALQELARICAASRQEGGAVKITLTANQLAVRLAAVEFVSRLIEGQYPDYKAIVPTKFGTRARLPRAELGAALKAAGLFSKAGVYDVAISFDPEHSEVTVASLNSQTGEHASAIAAEVHGASTKIAFNWKYLLEGVNALRGEQVLLRATDSASPTMLSEAEGADYFYLVMPIKE